MRPEPSAVDAASGALRAPARWWMHSRTSCSRPTSRCGRRGRRRGPCARWRATCSRSPAASSPSADWCARPRSTSLNGPLGPHRRYAWATTSVERHQAGAQGARRDLQRRRAGQHHQRVPRAAARARRGRRPRGAHAGARLGPAPRHDGQGRRRRHLREQGLGDVRRAPGRHRRPRPAAPRHHRADEGPQGLQSGAWPGRRSPPCRASRRRCCSPSACASPPGRASAT